MSDEDDHEDPPADDRIRVSFEITSEHLTVGQITAAIGFEPDRSWNRGDDRGLPPHAPDRGRRHTFTRWSVFSTLSSQDDMWDHLDDLYARCAAGLEHASALPDDTYRGLTVVRYFDGRAFQSHGGGISRQWVALLGRIGGEIDLDQYVLDEGPDDDWPLPSENARRRAAESP